MEIIKRKVAKEKKLKFYFTGKPCKHGHIVQRYVNGSVCVSCDKERYPHRADKVKAYQKEYRKTHKEYMNLRNKEHRRNNPRYRKYRNEYYKNNSNNIIFKLPDYLRTRIRNALKSNSKVGSAVHDLGCSINELKFHLETQFTRDMSWDNYGPYWHIDHIKPLSSFDLTNREQFLEACHYTNLQPLYWEDNLKKGAKLNF
jgi:hypothetical protein